MSKAKPKKAASERSVRELPPIGTRLSARYRGQEFSAEVVAAEGGEGAHVVECEGARHRSLSAAAKAITGNSVNGWRFWKAVEPQMTEEPEPATVE